MAFFCLYLIAVDGDIYISCDYPPLESWRQEGRYWFVHNTSDLTTKALPPGTSVVNPDATASSSINQPEQDVGYTEANEDKENSVEKKE